MSTLKFYMADGTSVDFNATNGLQDLSLSAVLISLAKERRFYNQVDWTVLQHSIACGFLAEELFMGNPLLIKHAYIHDFTEAFIRDIPSFLKNKEIRDVEDSLYVKICERFNVPPLSIEDKEMLKKIDSVMGCVEAAYFFAHSEQPGEMEKYYKDDLDLETVVHATVAMSKVSQLKVSDDGESVTDDILSVFVRVLHNNSAF